MTTSSDYIVRGDHLPVLAELAATQASGLDSPTALVWGVDLTSAPTKRAAHRLLRRECRDVAHASGGQRRLSHLFVVYTHGASLPEGSCLTAASQAATKLHAELERARARFVEVVLIDATGWEDGHALRQRIVQTVGAPRALPATSPWAGTRSSTPPSTRRPPRRSADPADAVRAAAQAPRQSSAVELEPVP